jgi:FkbM family methyltransferase
VNSKLLKTLAEGGYRSFGNTDITKIAGDRKIKIDWILEAGCHNGSDTVNLVNLFDPIRYLAFEPDETARKQAMHALSHSKLHAIELYPFGLSNINSSKFLKYEAEGKGSGSTHIADTGEDHVEIRVFDDHFTVKEQSGLLWLDVEGHTLQVLDGMSSILQKIVIAKIEVQLHTRYKDFVQDFVEVAQIMQLARLLPVYGPIYPGYFGDIVFINTNLLRIRDKVRSKILWILLQFLHLYLYPKIRKPFQLKNI